MSRACATGGGRAVKVTESRGKPQHKKGGGKKALKRKQLPGIVQRPQATTAKQGVVMGKRQQIDKGAQTTVMKEKKKPKITNN